MVSFLQKNLFVVSCLLFVFCLPVVSHASAKFGLPPNNVGMVGYWTMDGSTISGTSMTDVSGGGNTMTLVNSPAQTIGKIGQALNFSGAVCTGSYSTISSTPSSLDLSTFSISIWVYTS